MSKRHKVASLKLKSEFDTSNSPGRILKIRSFSILNKAYFVIAAEHGLVQLYERQRTSSIKKLSYKLVKEWHNCVLSVRDQVVAVGTFRNQYLYTCSAEGNFVVRDLINDDSDESVKSFLLKSPVMCVSVDSSSHNSQVKVAVGTGSDQLELYDLDLSQCLAEYQADEVGLGSLAHSTIMFYENHRFRFHQLSPTTGMHRAARNLFHTLTDFARVEPLTSVCTSDSDCPNVSKESIQNTIATIVSVDMSDGRYFCCGTHFGDLLIFRKSSNKPIQKERLMHLSQFPITNLGLFDCERYLVYTDNMSKIGIISTETWSVVNFYDSLNIGPALTVEFYFKDSCRVSKTDFENSFDPIYAWVTKITGEMLLYKLHADNSAIIKYTIGQVGIVPAFAVLDSNAYDTLDAVFGDEI